MNGFQVFSHGLWEEKQNILLQHIHKKHFNSFSSAAEITRAKPTWYFAGSYLRFSACYVDENNTIPFSEKFPIDTYNKMSTL